MDGMTINHIVSIDHGSYVIFTTGKISILGLGLKTTDDCYGRLLGRLLGSQSQDGLFRLPGKVFVNNKQVANWKFTMFNE